MTAAGGFGYGIAWLAALFAGKLVAGAISGILLTPLVKPVEARVPAVPRYIVPFVQGLVMGGAALLIAQWVLGAFGLKLNWIMVGALVAGFVVVFSVLYRSHPEEKHFHLSAMLGEVVGLYAVGLYLLGG